MLPISIYIHIPFCVKKCAYCDFLSYDKLGTYSGFYIRMLKKEIQTKAMFYKNRQVPTVFIGGGTPSILTGTEISEILDCLYSNFNIQPDAEITIEANPGTLSKDKLESIKTYGINRLSIGVQALQNRLLKLIGRIYTKDEFLKNYEDAKQAGFNINLDLMYALPTQTISEWEETLKIATSLKPDHVSAYGLILEENTKMFDYVGQGLMNLPSEDEYIEMNELTKNILSNLGYFQYEISNYSKPEKECKHNIVYWQCKEYVGLGLGAHSYVSGRRYCNTDSFKDYLEGDFQEKDVNFLTPADKQSEFMFMGLRMTKGVSFKEFKFLFGKNLLEEYAETISDLRKKGLIEYDNNSLFLTEKGINLSNVVFVEFL